MRLRGVPATGYPGGGGVGSEPRPPQWLSVLACRFCSAHRAHTGQNCPRGRVVHIIVPYAAGSNTGRGRPRTANHLACVFPNSSFIVSKIGLVPGGITGTGTLCPIGAGRLHALCVRSGGAITVPSVVEKGYDPLKDLEPVGLINTSALVMIVNLTRRSTLWQI